MSIEFREAVAADHATTCALVRAAFHDNEPEETAAFLDDMRNEGCILGEWLAEDETGIVAHIVFSRVWIESESASRSDAAMLTPLAVRPDRQRIGIGTALMGFALAALERRGEQVFVVLGHPDYYPRAGFSAEFAASLASPWSPRPAFMARARHAPRGRLVLPASIARAH